MPILDQEIVDSLKELAAGDPEFLPTMVSLFVDGTREKQKKIEAALAQGKLDEIAALFHQIKSSAGNLGALEMHKLCEGLEEKSKKGDRAAVEDDLKKFNSLLPQVEQELKKLLGK